MKKSSKQLGPMTYDAIRLQVHLCPSETYNLTDIATKAFGVSRASYARALHAVLVLQKRRRVQVQRAGRAISQVRSLDTLGAAYMQLEACLFLMIRLGQLPLEDE